MLHTVYMPLVSYLALLQPLEESSAFFTLLEEILLQQAKSGSLNKAIHVPYILKLDYTSGLFCFCTFHTSVPFPKPPFSHGCFPISCIDAICSVYLCWVERGRTERGVIEESWAVFESQHLICEGGFSSLVLCRLLPWHYATGNLSPDEVF